MAWDLRGNIHEEVARGTLLANGFTRDQVESFFPPYPAQRNASILAGGSVSNGAFVPGLRPAAFTPAKVASALEAVSAWRWGNIHTLPYATSRSAAPAWHRSSGYSTPPPSGYPGGGAMVNATGWDPSTGGYHTNAVPSMRMIVDLSNLDASRWIQLTGESGHAFTKHYSDQLDLWRTGQTVPMRWDQAGINATPTTC